MNNNFNNPHNANSSLIQSHISRINTAIPVKVTKVNLGEKTVNLLSMIDQKDAQGKISKVGPMNNVPYLRLQGGDNGIICDPHIDDEGLVIFCSRDISNVKNSNLPASNREYSRSDGVYIGALYNTLPKINIKFDDNTIEINAPTVKITGDIKVTGDAVIGGISFKEHIHKYDGKKKTTEAMKKES